MATYEFNEKIKFMLPAGFIFSRDEDDEGNEVVSILTGEYENDEGETSYKFNCRVVFSEYDPAEADDEFTSDNLLDLLAERMENSRLMKLPGTPKTILLNKGMPLSIFGQMMYASIGLVQVDDWAVMQLITSGTHNDDDPSVNTERYENLYEVLKATRINGKILPVDSITPSEIEEVLQLTFEEDGEAIILPDGITRIGEDAFFNNDTITSVVIPEGVETIEDGAFWMCGKLKSITLPSTLRKIGANAFNSTALTSIIIPDGCEEIGADCFTSCTNLKDIYVPASVYDIGDDAFYSFNDAMVIHTSKGSAAERMAKEHGWKVDYKSAPVAKAQTTTKKASVEKKSVPADDASGLADTMSDLSSQIAEMQNQELSEEDRKTLNEVMGTLDNLMDDLHTGQAAMDKYGDYLEQKEAREKAQEEEKARRKAEALAAGKSEKDIVNMYVILTNENKLGKLHRSQDNFAEIYEDDFAALSKAEIIKTRKDMLSEMEDESLCEYYAESFRQRSIKDRFSVSTLNLNNVSDEPNIWKKAEFAIANTKEWFTPEEYSEVRKLMDAELADTRKQIDDQLKPIEEGWMKFSSAIEFLQLNIAKKESDGSDMQDSWSCFQLVMGSNLVSVKLSTKGIFKMVTNVMNFNPWYWGVTIRDIWEAAFKNEIKDDREGAYDTNQIANQAMSQIRSKYPETKVSSTTTASYSKPSAPSSYSKPVSSPASTSYQNTSNGTNTTPQQPAKEEGCYIATAVYGSYDAPQVMTLRRFRDDTLRNSAFGRWFIRTYYRLSPPITEKLKNAKLINSLVRSLLEKWVARLNKKQ